MLSTLLTHVIILIIARWRVPVNHLRLRFVEDGGEVEREGNPPLTSEASHCCECREERTTAWKCDIFTTLIWRRWRKDSFKGPARFLLILTNQVPAWVYSGWSLTRKCVKGRWIKQSNEPDDTVTFVTWTDVAEREGSNRYQPVCTYSRRQISTRQIRDLHKSVGVLGL